MLRHDKNQGVMIRITMHDDIAKRVPSGVASDAESINLIRSGLLPVKYDCMYGFHVVIASSTSASWFWSNWMELGSHRGNLGELTEITYKSADPYPGFGEKFFLSWEGHQIQAMKLKEAPGLYATNLPTALVQLQWRWDLSSLESFCLLFLLLKRCILV